MQCGGELRLFCWIIPQLPGLTAAICWLTAQLLWGRPLGGMLPYEQLFWPMVES